MLFLQESTMTNKIYVGNLAYKINDEELKTMFSPYGSVLSAQVIVDRDTQRSKGFGFVEMETAESAEKAIKELNGSEIQGRALTVNLARPKENKRPGHFSRK